MARKPRRKQTVYTIHTTPTETRQIVLRGRRKPRKARLALIRKFNELVKSGLFEGLQFSPKGYFIGVEKWNRKPTEEESRIMRSVVLLTSEPLEREEHRIARSIGVTEPDLHKKWDRFIHDHESRGQFTWIHPTLEGDIMEGKDPMATIAVAEASNRTPLPGLRKRVARFNSPEKVKENLRRQLRYFEQLLKGKGKREMVICEERSNIDRSITRVKLTEEGVVRETVARVYSAQNYRTIVTLKPNGKITFESD